MYYEREAWRPCVEILNFIESIKPDQFKSVNDLGYGQSDKFIHVNRTMYHNTIRCLCANFLLTDAFAIIQRMKANGKEPGAVLYGNLYRAYASQLPLDSEREFKAMVDHSIAFLINQKLSAENGIYKHANNEYAYTGLISAIITSLCKRGYMNEAEAALSIIDKNGIKYGQAPLLTMVHAYSINGKWEKALHLYEAICLVQRDGSLNIDYLRPPPNSQKVYHFVCDGMLKAGKFDELAEFMLRHVPGGAPQLTGEIS
jgi:hypothetical protein